jgi:hypothetical protein
MNKELPTAEKFAKEHHSMKTYPADWNVMIEFAKMHVEAALKEASEKALTTWATTDFYDKNKVVSKNSILKSYPLTNIK